jgi:acyl-CoA thioester hydrolase
MFGQAVRTGVRVAHLGSRSLKMEYILEDAQTGKSLATGSTVVVTFDYNVGRTIPIPEQWRRAITEYEEIGAS